MSQQRKQQTPGAKKKLVLNRDTIKDLTVKNAERLKGGRDPIPPSGRPMIKNPDGDWGGC